MSYPLSCYDTIGSSGINTTIECNDLNVIGKLRLKNLDLKTGPEQVLHVDITTGIVKYGAGGGGGNGVPDPLILNNISALNTLSTNDLVVSGTVMADMNFGGMNINAVGDLNAGIVNAVDVNCERINGGAVNIEVYKDLDLRGTNKLLDVAQIDSSIVKCNTLDNLTVGANIDVLGSMDFQTVFNINRVGVLGATTVNGSTVNATNINASVVNGNLNGASVNSSSISGGNIVVTGNVGCGWLNGNVRGSNAVVNRIDCGNLVATGNITCSVLNYGSLFPPIGGTVLSRLFFNRLTNILLSGTINTANQILLLNGVNGTDYLAVVNNDFTLNVGTSTFTYSGTGTKNFYIQTSGAIQIGGSSTTIGIELRKNGAGVSQVRWGTIAAAGFVDIQDFNVVSLSAGDNISWFYSASTTAGTLISNSQTGLAGSTTKPFQINIVEI